MNTCFQSPILAAWGNACPLLGTWVLGLFYFSHLESLESLDRGANAYAEGEIKGSVEGRVDGSGRRRRHRRYEGDRGHQGEVSFLGSELEGRRRRLLRSRRGQLLSNTLLQLLLHVFLSSSLASAGTSSLLPCPISVLLLLLLELHRFQRLFSHGSWVVQR